MQIPKRPLAIAAIVVGVAVVLYALLSRKSDEELIRERVARLAEVVAVDGDENPLFRGRRLQKEFAEIFLPNVRVDIRELTSQVSGRDELVGLATRAGSVYRHADISLEAERIQLVGGSTSAQLDAVAVLTADSGSGLRRDERKVEFGLTKTNDGWRVDSVVVTPKDEAAP